MLKHCIGLFLFLPWICPLPAQPLISSGAVLASAHRDLSVDLQGKQLDFIQKNQRNLPFVDQVGVRTETDRFELRRQEYLARVNVNGIGEMRQQRRLLQAEQLEEESRLRIFLHEALLERCQILAASYLAQRRLALQQQMRLVYDDRINVLQRMAAADAGADVTDLIKAEYDRDELTLSIAETEGQLQHYRQMIGLYLTGTDETGQLDTAGFIQAPDIAQVVTAFPETGFRHPELDEKQADIGRIDAEYALEKARARQMLDFFQARHHNRPEEGFNRAFSVSLGLNLPYKGSSRVKMSELKIEKNAAANELQMITAELNRQTADYRRKIGVLAGQYRVAQQQWQNSQARFTLEQAGLLREAGPLPLLEAREGQLKRQFNLLDIESEIMENYLEILDRGGFLSQPPLINYLASGLPRF